MSEVESLVREVESLQKTQVEVLREDGPSSSQTHHPSSLTTHQTHHGAPSSRHGATEGEAVAADDNELGRQFQKRT